jgi:hypothetical protein
MIRLSTLLLAAGMFGAVAVTKVRSQNALPPESHQFDFWLGQWEVFDQQGTPSGTSHVDSIAEGNGLLENWTDASGTTGKSLNVFNVQKRCWQQFWVGDGTPVLELSGSLVGTSMVLSGERTTPAGTKVLDRITWTPNADGSVTQHWVSSLDAGKTWRENFLGIYRRKGTAAKP